MEKSKLSSVVNILMPVLNGGDYILRALLSIIHQSGDVAIRLHVQDGGSTDATLDIVRRIEDGLNTGVLPHTCASVAFSYDSAPDAGMYDAIRIGFRRLNPAPGDWMTWLNADDQLTQGTFALLAAVDASAHRDEVHWLCGVNATVANDVVVSTGSPPISEGLLVQGLCDGRHWAFLQQEGVFFRGAVWNSIDADRFAALRYAGDWELWRMMAARWRLHQIDRPLGLFTRRAGQISAVHRADYMAEIDALAPRGRRMAGLRRLQSIPMTRRRLVARLDGAIDVEEQAITYHPKAYMMRNTGPHHDAEWQYPAETEKRAFEAARDSLPLRDGVVYLGFPWATLIDKIDNKQDYAALMKELHRCARELPPGARVVTACQHIRMLSHRELFELAKVTDIYWSHTPKGMKMWPGRNQIRVWPFPLYPVQHDPKNGVEGGDRPILFSFAGAKANTWYLSDTRALLIAALSDHPRGVIKGREEWHYNRIVYQHQIRGGAPGHAGLVDQQASDEFRDLLQTSVFALCPSGSGPNSIRLWEAIGAGAIPVILADGCLLPGDRRLWEAAAVFCPETEDDIRALPERLAALSQDADLIERMRQAGRQLWLLYGPDNFIADVRRLYFEHQPAGESSEPLGAPRLKVHLFGRHSRRTPFAYAPYRALLKPHIALVDRAEEADILVAGFDADLLEHRAELGALKARRPDLAIAVISEEPLWDSVWSKGFSRRQQVLGDDHNRLPIFVVNHFTSDLYDFATIPYFCTTSDDYPARYSFMFDRNMRRAPAQVLEQWRAAPIRAAFYLERRDEPGFDVADPTHDLLGLSRFRSTLADLATGDGVARVGRGWPDTAHLRQSLPDWHLDKLAALDGRSFVVSALENTHARNYVTEKIFDAFAVGGVPLYYASPEHRVHELVGRSVINLHGRSAEEAVSLLAVQPDAAFAEGWLETQADLAARFCDADRMWAERERVARRLVEILQLIKAGAWRDNDQTPSPQLAAAPAARTPTSPVSTGPAAPLVFAPLATVGRAEAFGSSIRLEAAFADASGLLAFSARSAPFQAGDAIEASFKLRGPSGAKVRAVLARQGLGAFESSSADLVLPEHGPLDVNLRHVALARETAAYRIQVGLVAATEVVELELEDLVVTVRRGEAVVMSSVASPPPTPQVAPPLPPESAPSAVEDPSAAAPVSQDCLPNMLCQPLAVTESSSVIGDGAVQLAGALPDHYLSIAFSSPAGAFEPGDVVLADLVVSRPVAGAPLRCMLVRNAAGPFESSQADIASGGPDEISVALRHTVKTRMPSFRVQIGALAGPEGDAPTVLSVDRLALRHERASTILAGAG